MLQDPKLKAFIIGVSMAIVGFIMFFVLHR